jgi:hypothetical protein
MKFARVFMFSIFSVAVSATNVVMAQDYALTATYETFALSSGFTPDPESVNVDSGGSIDASRLGGNCGGFVANAPDVEFSYDAGTVFSLWVTVRSDSDTTLVINTPNGDWVCDDDSGDGLDPSVFFDDAPSGVYDVWIGTYGSDDIKDAELLLSELGPYGG